MRASKDTWEIFPTTAKSFPSINARHAGMATSALPVATRILEVARKREITGIVVCNLCVRRAGVSVRGHCSETKLLDAVANLVTVQTEERASLRLITTAPLERLNDQAALELFEIDACGR